MRALLFLFFALPTLASAQSLPDLSWLKGCWRLQQGDTVITEVWSAPPMGVMLGYAYTMRGGVLTEWEQTRIQIADGVPTFMAMPGGRAQTPVRDGGERAAYDRFRQPGARFSAAR